eukprot:CAMPEP_0198290160 /NCGR_PEP_ID=MMETSP1449-20131203/8119_1 /TAXON_ID=420275 /ORGANISM="Attheya septentrionalis, Strain CCMP2084" /LENGTH=421 /DNA_ID=CAMNT_0043988619 /DNA_START=161 /DNA_END=1423 /DNA_ORIENTATION=-
MQSPGDSSSTEKSPLLRAFGANNNDPESNSVPENGVCPPHRPSVGYLGSLSIVANTLTGPGMLALPATYQLAGFIPTTVAIVVVCTLCAFCALNLANVISKAPGNSNFERELEYSETFRIFWGHKWFIMTQIAFFICILCQTVASIVDTAQVVDEFMGTKGTNGWGVRLYPRPVEFIEWDSGVCLQHTDTDFGIDNRDDDTIRGGCDPFSDQPEGAFIITLGYLLSALAFLPLGLMDLKENAAWQIFGFLFLLAVSVQFIFVFIQQGLSFGNLSLWGSTWGHLFGIVLFNFTAVTTVPSLLYEKAPSVGVPHVIHTASILSAVLYIVVGALGAMAIPNVSENMLSSMIAGAFGTTTQIGASLFAFVIIGLGIPLFSVLMRLNLVGSGLCSQKTGNFFAVYLPWALSWTLYFGESVKELLSW